MHVISSKRLNKGQRSDRIPSMKQFWNRSRNTSSNEVWRRRKNCANGYRFINILPLRKDELPLIPTIAKEMHTWYKRLSLMYIHYLTSNKTHRLGRYSRTKNNQPMLLTQVLKKNIFFSQPAMFLMRRIPIHQHLPTTKWFLIYLSANSSVSQMQTASSLLTRLRQNCVHWKTLIRPANWFQKQGGSGVQNITQVINEGSRQLKQKLLWLQKNGQGNNSFCDVRLFGSAYNPCCRTRSYLYLFTQ